MRTGTATQYCLLQRISRDMGRGLLSCILVGLVSWTHPATSQSWIAITRARSRQHTAALHLEEPGTRAGQWGAFELFNYITQKLVAECWIFNLLRAPAISICPIAPIPTIHV